VSGLLLAAALGAGVSIADGPRALFGGEPWKVSVDARSDERFTGPLLWRLVVSGRAVARGEQTLSLEPGVPERIAFTVPVPRLAEGVALPARLAVSLGDRAPVEAVAWLFGRDPIAGTRQRLESAGLPVLDAGGGARPLFEDLRLQPIWLEGAPALAACVARGAPALVLAPRPGALTLPRPRAIRLRGDDVIGELDPRLDRAGWLPDGAAAAATLHVRSDAASLTVETVAGGAGWSWCELDYGPGRGTIVLCTLAFAEAWESGPSPRFFLARLLEGMVRR
jgi:hypothetical protein